jgi:ComF family protein
VGELAVRDSLFLGPGPGSRTPVIRGVVAACSYRATPRALVLALKFGHRPRAADLLGEMLGDALWRAGWPGDLLVPVPLSARRLRARGYNQAELLARSLVGERRVECRPSALRRRRDTQPQTGRSRAARRRGPAGAFLAEASLVAGRCVLLVDDVLTTGGTARACALALRRAGALHVELAVACRSERGSR